MFVLIHHSAEGDRPVYSGSERNCRGFAKGYPNEQFTLWQTGLNLEPEAIETFMPELELTR